MLSGVSAGRAANPEGTSSREESCGGGMSDRYAVIVTGSRHWKGDRYPLIASVIANLPPGSVVLHGAARGVDTLAARAATDAGHAVESYPANWDSYGKRAGPIRNSDMLGRLCILRAEGMRVETMAFHDDPALGHGTADMVRKARAAGIPVTVYDGKEAA